MRTVSAVVFIGVGVLAHSERAMGQDFLVPQPRAVEFSGTISAMNPQTRIITIETKDGTVFALTHPTRRTIDRQLIGGIPPVRVRLSVFESPRALPRGSFIQFRAKLDPRNVVVEPVRDIRVVSGLPRNGFGADMGGPDAAAPGPDGPEGPIPAIEGGPGPGMGPDLDVIEEMRERLPPEIRDRLGDGPLDRARPGPAGAGPAAVGDGRGGDGRDGDGRDGDGRDGDGRDGDGADTEDGGIAKGDEVEEDGADEDGADEEGPGLTRSMLVTGQITSNSRRQINVLVPVDGRKQRVRFELAEDALVLIETDDLSLAAVGDPIRALGEAVELPRFFATELVITHVSDDLPEAALARLDDSGRLIEPGIAAGGEAPDERAAEPGAADGVPVDPFEIVKREREARENEAGRVEEKEEPAGKPGSVFHGRIIKIN